MQRRTQFPNDHTVSEIIAQIVVNSIRYSQWIFFFGTIYTKDWMIQCLKPDGADFTL